MSVVTGNAVQTDIFRNIKCLVCQNDNPERFAIRYHKKNCDVVECLNCSFHFIPPYYREKIDYKNYKSSDVTREIKKSDPWIKIQRNLLRYQLIRRYKRSGKIYDVGAGFGHFMLTGQQLGFKVTGIELSKANVDFARNELNLPVKFGDFLAEDESQKYDIITFWDVLEHIDEAEQVILKAKRLLKSDGYIFLQVPQWNSFFQRLTRDKWWAMGLDHVNYFSRRTITRLLTTHGFEVRTIKPSIELKNIYTYVILPKLKRKKKAASSWTAAERQQAFNKMTKRPRWLLWMFVKIHNLAYKTCAFLQLDDEMIVVARRSQF